MNSIITSKGTKAKGDPEGTKKLAQWMPWVLIPIIVTPINTITLNPKHTITLVVKPKLYGMLLIKLANKINENSEIVIGMYSEKPSPTWSFKIEDTELYKVSVVTVHLVPTKGTVFINGKTKKPNNVINTKIPYNVNLVKPMLIKGKGKNKMGFANCSNGEMAILKYILMLHRTQLSFLIIKQNTNFIVLAFAC